MTGAFFIIVGVCYSYIFIIVKILNFDNVSQFGYDGYAVRAIGSDELGNEIISCLSKKKLK